MIQHLPSKQVKITCFRTLNADNLKIWAQLDVWLLRKVSVGGCVGGWVVVVYSRIESLQVLWTLDLDLDCDKCILEINNSSRRSHKLNLAELMWCSLVKYVTNTSLTISFNMISRFQQLVRAGDTLVIPVNTSQNVSAQMDKLKTINFNNSLEWRMKNISSQDF